MSERGSEARWTLRNDNAQSAPHTNARFSPRQPKDNASYRVPDRQTPCEYGGDDVSAQGRARDSVLIVFVVIFQFEGWPANVDQSEYKRDEQ